MAGAALVAGTLALLVHTLAGVPGHGWDDPRTLLGAAATVVLGALLVAHERRSTEPIVPVPVLRSRPVTASMTILLCASAGLFGGLFTATFQLQDVAGLGPLESALRVLPLTVLMVLGSPLAAVAVRRHGPRATALTGTALLVLGTAGLSRLGPQTGWAVTGLLFTVLGAGFATVMVTGTVVGEAPVGYAGVIGGLKQTAVNIGPTLGIAVAAGLTTAGGPPPPGPTLLALSALTALALVPAALLPAGPTGPEQGARPAPA
ncbi:MFS transporter [Kitasatospora sp. NBC_00240]|uniref:MFS transporter n=1 Tax=Kitasatospora sp. NBC_00240 TaxID=2903567 RepID=UPI002B1E5169|nr:MFS transporter [Kitasatospora sp. NBC_00240]